MIFWLHCLAYCYILRFVSSYRDIVDDLMTRVGLQVLIGGGENHRMGLYDMVMVKDNHIAVAGGIRPAITAVEKFLKSKNLDIGVEVILEN